ncbi:het-domain-containing protein [Ophiostoma piceae UAMH 11346]|uniref:Het-domain-containing protein n=1 Tax=Ophiostoma piceae (strain UAMH 11346) TaxID=1262450 RepID=S3BXL5_OPHP1|nr:het-domain-containing protein [Ophiostoma piceae UAMH 11346]
MLAFSAGGRVIAVHLADGRSPQLRTFVTLIGNLSPACLWVDSLYGVQDDDSDKQHQLPLMVQLYKRAEVVIVAASGRDANGGRGPGRSEGSTHSC